MKTIHLFGDKAYEVSDIDGRLDERLDGRYYYHLPAFKLQELRLTFTRDGVRYEPVGLPVKASTQALDGLLKGIFTAECGAKAVAESLATGRPLPLWGDAAKAVNEGKYKRVEQALKASEAARAELQAASEALWGVRNESN